MSPSKTSVFFSRSTFCLSASNMLVTFPSMSSEDDSGGASLCQTNEKKTSEENWSQLGFFHQIPQSRVGGRENVHNSSTFPDPSRGVPTLPQPNPAIPKPQTLTRTRTPKSSSSARLAGRARSGCCPPPRRRTSRAPPPCPCRAAAGRKARRRSLISRVRPRNTDFEKGLFQYTNRTVRKYRNIMHSRSYSAPRIYP